MWVWELGVSTSFYMEQKKKKTRKWICGLSSTVANRKCACRKVAIEFIIQHTNCQNNQEEQHLALTQLSIEVKLGWVESVGRWVGEPQSTTKHNMFTMTPFVAFTVLICCCFPIVEHLTASNKAD